MRVLDSPGTAVLILYWVPDICLIMFFYDVGLLAGIICDVGPRHAMAS